MLKYRRELHTLNFIYGVANTVGNLRPGTKDAVVMRSQKKKILGLKRPETEKFKKSLAYMGPKEWNALALDLHQAEDKWVFKRLARNWVNHKALAGRGVIGDP